MKTLITDAPVGDEIRDLTPKEAKFLLVILGGFKTETLLPADIGPNMHGVAPPRATKFLIDCLIRKAPKTRFDKTVVIWTSYLCRNPESIMLWAYALCQASWTEGRVIDMQRLSELMPHGVPTDARYETLWRAQREALTTEEAWIEKEI